MLLSTSQCTCSPLRKQQNIPPGWAWRWGRHPLTQLYLSSVASTPSIDRAPLEKSVFINASGLAAASHGASSWHRAGHGSYTTAAKRWLTEITPQYLWLLLLPAFGCTQENQGRCWQVLVPEIVVGLCARLFGKDAGFDGVMELAEREQVRGVMLKRLVHRPQRPGMKDAFLAPGPAVVFLRHMFPQEF